MGTRTGRNYCFGGGSEIKLAKVKAIIEKADASVIPHRPPRFNGLFPYDNIGVARLILDRHEDDAVGRARPLADQDHAGDLDIPLVLRAHGVLAGDDAALGELRPQEAKRMWTQGQTDIVIVYSENSTAGTHGGHSGRCVNRNSANSE